MTLFSRRTLFTSALLASLAPNATLFAAEKPKEIVIDWATYNPVSLLLKDKGFLEKEFAKDGIGIRWVQTVSSSNRCNSSMPVPSTSARPRDQQRWSRRSMA